jgi:hypothetical protein
LLASTASARFAPRRIWLRMLNVVPMDSRRRGLDAEIDRLRIAVSASGPARRRRSALRSTHVGAEVEVLPPALQLRLRELDQAVRDRVTLSTPAMNAGASSRPPSSRGLGPGDRLGVVSAFAASSIWFCSLCS